MSRFKGCRRAPKNAWAGRCTNRIVTKVEKIFIFLFSLFTLFFCQVFRANVGGPLLLVVKVRTSQVVHRLIRLFLLFGRESPQETTTSSSFVTNTLISRSKHCHGKTCHNIDIGKVRTPHYSQLLPNRSTHVQPGNPHEAKTPPSSRSPLSILVVYM